MSAGTPRLPRTTSFSRTVEHPQLLRCRCLRHLDRLQELLQEDLGMVNRRSQAGGLTWDALSGRPRSKTSRASYFSHRKGSGTADSPEYFDGPFRARDHVPPFPASFSARPERPFDLEAAGTGEADRASHGLTDTHWSPRDPVMSSRLAECVISGAAPTCGVPLALRAPGDEEDFRRLTRCATPQGGVSRRKVGSSYTVQV